MIRDFHGNRAAAEMLEEMVRGQRIHQTLLLAGPAGIGKATLARRFAALLLGDAARIEQDDLSSEANRAMLAEREGLPAEKRNSDPLLLASHPDFVTFPPDGPLRQITIQQMRLLKERAQFKPLRGRWRVFLIDGIDRANEQAANSLLKTLEEPPSHLVLIMTAQNAYDLLPTIRSRAVQIPMGRLESNDMQAFAETRALRDMERRLALARGAPGLAAAIDLQTYDQRRAAMLKLLEVGAGAAPFSQWAVLAESIAARKSEKLEYYLEVLYLLIEDLLLLANRGSRLSNPDIRPQLEKLAARVSFEWIRNAVGKVDDLVVFSRRNIQKGIALDALALDLKIA